MEGPIIQINAAYFLGIMGALIAIAYYCGGRFTAIETNIVWIKEILGKLDVSKENKGFQAFANNSPISLLEKGRDLLVSSGMKDYIDVNLPRLLSVCDEYRDSNEYEIQEQIFKYFDDVVLDADLDKKIKKDAFDKGIGVNLIRRVGAIYFRDICLSKFNKDIKNIDKRGPQPRTD